MAQLSVERIGLSLCLAHCGTVYLRSAVMLSRLGRLCRSCGLSREVSGGKSFGRSSMQTSQICSG